GAVGVDEHTVGTIHRNRERIAIAAVARGARPGDHVDDARRSIDPTHRVTLGVREPDIAGRIERDALGSAERGEFRRATVARETGFARAGDVTDDTGLRVKP